MVWDRSHPRQTYCLQGVIEAPRSVPVPVPGTDAQPHDEEVYTLARVGMLPGASGEPMLEVIVGSVFQGVVWHLSCVTYFAPANKSPAHTALTGYGDSNKGGKNGRADARAKAARSSPGPYHSFHHEGT